MKRYKLFASLIILLLAVIGGYTYSNAQNDCHDSGSTLLSRALTTKKAFLGAQVAIDYTAQLTAIGQKELVGNCGNGDLTKIAMGLMSYEEKLPADYKIVSIKVEGFDYPLETENVTTTNPESVKIHFPHVVEFSRTDKKSKAWSPTLYVANSTGELSKLSGSTLKWRIVLETPRTGPRTTRFQAEDGQFKTSISTDGRIGPPNGNAWGYCKYGTQKNCGKSGFTAFNSSFASPLDLRLFEKPAVVTSFDEVYVNQKVTAKYSLTPFDSAIGKIDTNVSYMKKTGGVETIAITKTGGTKSSTIQADIEGQKPGEQELIRLSTTYQEILDLNKKPVVLTSSHPFSVRMPIIKFTAPYEGAKTVQMTVGDRLSIPFEVVDRDGGQITLSKMFTYTATSGDSSKVSATSTFTTRSIPVAAVGATNTNVEVKIGFGGFENYVAGTKLFSIYDDAVTLQVSDMWIQSGSTGTAPVYTWTKGTDASATPPWYSGYRLELVSGNEVVELRDGNVRPLKRGKARVRFIAQTIDRTDERNPRTVDKVTSAGRVEAEFNVYVHDAPNELPTNDLY